MCKLTSDQSNTSIVRVSSSHYFPSGPPSAPVLTAVQSEGLTSFDFTITPSNPPDCVVNYIITTTSSEGSRSITVPASDDESITRTVEGFEVCNKMYTITVVPEISGGILGMRSASVFSGM